MTNNTHYSDFKALHLQPEPLVLINIWDAASARISQRAGAKALAAGSASLAWSLGYPDGNALPTTELLKAIARIQRVVNIPLSVDIEGGYSDNIHEVVALTQALSQLGVVGINIEDGSTSPKELSRKINAIKTACPQLFINARTDVYLAQLTEPQHRVQEVTKRLQSYQQAGADCGFIPAFTDVTTAQTISKNLNLPINLMAKDTDTITEFVKAGIARISVGPGSFLTAYQTLMSYPIYAEPVNAEKNQLNFNLLNGEFEKILN